jgi:hypothetical protein
MVDLSEEGDESFCTDCAKPYSMSRALQSGSSALFVIDWPTTFAPYSVTSVFVATAPLMTIRTVSCL